MDTVVYGLFRLIEALIKLLPIGCVFALGRTLGGLMRWLLPGYRHLVRRNLQDALGDAHDRGSLRRIEREHFRLLGGNLLAAIKTPYLSEDALMERVEIEGLDELKRIAAQDGVVLAIPHTGNWELYAQLAFLLPDIRTGAVYQALRNQRLDHHLNATRRRSGMATFNRARGFHEAIDFLREGGVVGILVDQHSGDAGVWTPFFNRLASTSPLAATLAWRSGAKICCASCQTLGGQARWRFAPAKIIPPSQDIEATTAEINQVIESAIRDSPADWFWVHNRWKVPKPNFLLNRYRRGVHVPREEATTLRPFRVMLRSPNWLGDAIMALPAAQAISRGRPDIEITVVTRPNLAPFWRRVPFVHKVVPLAQKKRLFKDSQVIRQAGPFDVAVLLPNSLRTALEARWAGIAYVAGFGNASSRFLLKTSPPTLPTLHPPEHHGRRYLRLAHWLGAGIDPAGPLTLPRLSVSPKSLVDDQAMSVACCPGAEYGPAKRWPLERFAEVAAKVAQRRHTHWLLLGVAKDQPITGEVAEALGSSATDLAGKTSLDELIDILAGCRLLLTNDTGTMHLAAALQIPVVAIFGSTEPVLTGPITDNAIVLRIHVECSPCFKRECPLDFRCMTAVTVDSAVEAVLRLMEKPVAPSGR